eukprot:4960642-Alexandrium_andersonii.AAC.1
MSASLVGSEMCIRDRARTPPRERNPPGNRSAEACGGVSAPRGAVRGMPSAPAASAQTHYNWFTTERRAPGEERTPEIRSTSAD